MITDLLPPAFVDTIQAIKGASPVTYLVTSALTVVFFGIMRSMLPNPGLAIVYAPFIAIGGLSAPYLLRAQGIVFSYEEYANTILSVTTGTAITLILLVLLTRGLYSLCAGPALERRPEPIVGRQVDISRALSRARDE